jgi:hypothetical protein
MKNKVKINVEKAGSLSEMAKITFERLNSTEKFKYPSNTLNDYYDILHKLMESFSTLKGIKFSGINAHKELIDYICEEIFSIHDKNFLQNLRQFRNQISYEGFNVSEDFLIRNIERIEGYIKRLIKEIEQIK